MVQTANSGGTTTMSDINQPLPEEEVTIPHHVTSGIEDSFPIPGNVLSSSDKTVFGIFVASFALIILMMMVKIKTNIHSHFLSNRSLSFFPMACSMVMSNIGAAQFVGVAGLASRAGLTVYGYELSVVVSIIILGWVFFPIYIASGSMTTIDYLKKRFGSKRIEIYMSLLSLILLISSKISVELYAISKLLQTTFQQDPSVIGLPILIVGVLIPASGGLLATVYANTFQALLLLIGGFFISYFSLNKFESYIELKEKYYEAWPNTTRAHFGDNSTYKYTTCGIPRSTSWHIIQPYDNLEFPWPGMVFGTTINNLWYWCCDQLIVQNGLGAKNIIHCKYACLITGYVKIVSILFLVLPGLVSRILYTNSVACADPDLCEHICGLRTGCSNLAFPSIFLDVVPQNYRGYVLVAILVCSISSLATCLNCGSTIFTINIYRNFRPLASELELICITKTSLVSLAIISLLWMSLVEDITSLYSYMQSIISLISPPMIAVFICGMVWDRVTEKTAFGCLIAGLFISSTRLFWEATRKVLPCGEEDQSQTPDIIYNFHFLHFAIFLFVLSLAFIILLSIFAEPTMKVHLYRLTYWLRHSRLDRVDIAELESAYDAFLRERKICKKDLDINEWKQTFEYEQVTHSKSAPVKECPSWFSMICCMDSTTANTVISNNELREASKYKISITESESHSKALNIHAVILLLISAVMWGYLC